MEDLNIQVLQGFSVKAKRIVKEKSYYICSTDKGMRVINKSMETIPHIEFQHSIKEYLFNASFPDTDRFYLSNMDKPFFEFDDNIYVMTDYFNQRESDFSNNKDFQRIITSVAKMHSSLKGISFDEPFYGGSNLLELVKKSIRDFNSIKRRIGTQKRLSDFDVLFIKNFDYYINLMKTSLNMLQDIDICLYEDNIKRNNPICHNLLKEEHLLHDSEHLYITTFTQASIDNWANDICAIIQRYAKQLPANPVSIDDILDLYNKFNTLTRTDLNVLFALLKFPLKYIKICNQYYMKKRTWTPSAIINRVESIISNKDDYNDFIDNRV